MYTKLKPNLESILIHVNQFINIDRDREEYASHFENIKIKIFTHLRETPPFGSLFNGYQLGGSYGDNLKVTRPDEFDLVFRIRFPESKLINVIEDDEMPGNVHLDFTRVLAKIRKEKQHEITYKYLTSQWLDANNRLVVDKLQSYFQSCFTKTLTEMNWEFRLNGESTRLRYHREGPAHTIKVIGARMKYSVDFVPGILLDPCQSITPTDVGQWEAIPKPIKWARNNYTSFRSSYYLEEQQLIKNCNNLKNCLRMMKKFRDAHSNMSPMKSYFIKTLFLWKVKEEGSKSYWNKSLTIIILDMFKSMEQSLINGVLPFFWDRRLNMYDQLSRANIREMLGCVVGARTTLEKARFGLTLPLQKRVYEVFLKGNKFACSKTANCLRINYITTSRL
ncbi:cGAS-like receptor 2 isoform X2 [Musca autumnalis]|uniref:cGAS-like receptor 2 isoform X2 n=1 Tax=Musca autumnalis TaxID=221902 RepID=UPI003CE88C10